MKKLLTYICLTLWVSLSIYGQSLEVDIQKFDYKTEKFDYSRFNIYYLGATMPYKQEDSSTYRTSLLTTLLIKQGEKILHAERHQVTSEATVKTDFTDSYKLQIDPGEYTLIFLVKNTDTDSVIYERTQDIEVRKIKSPNVSDIMLLQSFNTASDSVKTMKIRGIPIKILPYRYVPDTFDQLTYFVEYYPDSAQKNVYLLEHIDEYDDGQWVERGRQVTNLADMGGITPMFRSMKISNIESGQYRLEVDIITRNMDTLASANIFFIRSNPNLDLKMKIDRLKEYSDDAFVDDFSPDKLEYCLKAIAPIVPQDEVPILNAVLLQKKTQGMKAFLFNFWMDKAPINTEIKFNKYMEVARAIDREFNNGMGYGFETDRGRVFMRYGRPTSITSSETDMASVPYEIWVYNYIKQTKQSHVKFIFYNPNLVTNGYELLHTTLRGGIKNPKWELYIYDAPNQVIGNPVDATRMERNINRNARRFYEDN